MLLDPWPLAVNIVVLAVMSVVIALAGWRLARVADMLADRTGLGEAVTGALLLGAATSLPGIMATVAAASGGRPELAMSNALGGIAAQTMFLAIADVAHRGVNLEHAAASSTNILQCGMLILLLTVILAAMTAPEVTLLGVHPATPLLAVVYIVGLRAARKAQESPMWRPEQTRETREDTPDDDSFKGPSTTSLWIRFVIFAAIIGVAGWSVAQAGAGLARQTGISDSVVGALLTAVSTSLPELITAIAAVRQGALTLAVGNIVGGNAFDTLFAAAGDVAFRGGSIYHAVAGAEIFLVSLCLLMTSTLLVGLVVRERRGLANIGLESVLLLALYPLGMVVLMLR